MFDAIVIGTGGIGSAALFELARAGVKVLGLDRFRAGHDRGSSHGHSRIIRRSYFEHPSYVPMLDAAYQMWDELAARHDRPLFQRTGLVYSVAPNGPVHAGVLASSKTYEIKVERLSDKDAANRFPGLVSPHGNEVLFEPDAGMLLVEDCVKAFVQDALGCGASLICDESVRHWAVVNGQVEVTTDRNKYQAAKLIVTAGSWARRLLSDLDLPLTVQRKHMHWFNPISDLHRLENGGCCFFTEAFGGYFYGFPDDGTVGVKVAEHSGGTKVVNPLEDDRSPSLEDSERVDRFRATLLKGVSSRRLAHQTCYYTMTPDEHFIVDHHPKYPQVVMAAGMSGHGFKFAPALGRILSEMTLDNASMNDLEFLRLDRPGLRG